MEKNVKDSLDAISIRLYNAAMEVDEFRALGMDQQGEVIKNMVTSFLLKLTGEIKSIKD